MAEFIVLFLLYLIAALVGANEFTIFLIFLGLALVILARRGFVKETGDKLRSLEARLKGVELNQQQLLQKLQHVEQGVSRAPNIASEPLTVVKPVEPITAPSSQPIVPTQPARTPSAPAPSATPVSPAPAAPVRPAPESPTFPKPDRPQPPAPVVRPVQPAAAMRAPVAQPAAMRAAAAPSKSAAPPRKTSFDIEELLGTNWMPKVGVVLFVFGVAFLLAYAWSAFPPAVKILIGYMGSALLVIGGARLGKAERYRILGYAGIGGGWALAFFTTYAMHYIGASRIIGSELLDLVLLLGVAAAMVAHTLRYQSQTVTGLAFLLGFSTVTIGHSNAVFSLVAGAMLATGLVILVRRFAWFELEVLGIVASYLNHYYWLRPIIEPMGERHHWFAEFPYSAALLLFYWAIFRASYLLREIKNAAQEKVSTLAAVLNTGLLLALLKYQSVHREWAFWGLLALGTAELVLGQLPVTRKRRTAFVMLSTLGVLLLLSAFPFRYSGSQLSILWLLDAEALLLAGVFAREILFRRFAMLASLAAAAQILATQMGDAGSNPAARFVFGMAALLFYSSAVYIPRRWAALINTQFERECFRALSYLAAVMAICGIWVGTSQPWIAPLWALLAAILAASAWRMLAVDLRIQAYGFAIAAFGRALLYNYDFISPPASHWNLRVFTVGIVATALYACGAFNALQGGARLAAGRIAQTTAASLLLVMLAWYEFPNPWLAVVWMLFAVVLTGVGRYARFDEFSWQAGALALVIFGRVLIVNLYTTELYLGHSVRLITVALVIAGYYGMALLLRGSNPNLKIVGWAHTWAAAGLLATLAWYELHDPNSVAVAWTLIGVALFELGMTLPAYNFRLQGYVGLAASFVRVLVVNLNAAPETRAIDEKLLTVVPLIIALFYVYARLRWAADKSAQHERGFHAAECLAYLGTATTALLLYFELSSALVVVGWAAMALLLMAVASVSGRKTFLHQALLLSLPVLVRGVLFNLYDRSLVSGDALHGRWFTVLAAAALLLLALPFAFRLKTESQGAGLAALLERWPEQILFFVPLILITWLLDAQISSGMLTMAWAIEAVIVFVFALVVGVRSFRLTGLGLLMLCVGKIVVIDVWRLGPRDRYLTFIGLGALLIGVSFLYSRYREAIRQYI